MRLIWADGSIIPISGEPWQIVWKEVWRNFLVSIAANKKHLPFSTIQGRGIRTELVYLDYSRDWLVLASLDYIVKTSNNMKGTFHPRLLLAVCPEGHVKACFPVLETLFFMYCGQAWFS